jgi:hypothetical protein
LEKLLESGNYLKTELEVVTVNDLDGEPPSGQQERNFLREKTFNSELNSLVNKIFNNEKIGEEPPDSYIESDPVERNSLLIKCEKLIYQLKHSEDLNTISSSYNPFEMDINVYDDIDDTADYIKAGLLQSGYSKYQILKYNFNDKAYRSDINLLDQSYTTEMYFSINDTLITRLKDHAEGFILSPDLISADPFFSKKFLNTDTDETTSRTFYIIKISSLFKNLLNIKSFESRISKFEEYLSPLMLIDVTDTGKIKSDLITGSLKKTAALPLMLYFLKNRIKFSINNYSYEDTLLMIELFIRSAVNTRLKSYIITLKDYSTKENVFILKFLLSKLRKILKKDSLILRISLNSAAAITSSSLDDIYNIIDRVNSSSEIITIKSIDYNEYLNIKEFVNLFL